MWAQEENTEEVFTFEQFLDIVKTQHPVAMQADLLAQQGDASVLRSKGAFDPKLFSDISQKYFDGTNYYNLSHSGLTIPTWFGADFVGAYEQNGGLFLNPEGTVPGTGLWYAGISIPLGQGLLMDKRRAELRQAQIYRQSTEAERDILMNNLLYEAGSAYWEWFMANNVAEVFEEALALANQRLEAVRQGVSFGDRAAIDTVEAKIQVQNRLLGWQEAQLNLANSRVKLSVYLWAEGLIPLEIGVNTVPLSSNLMEGVPQDDDLMDRLAELIQQHPKIRSYGFKLDQLGYERRLKREQLKPVVDLKYNAISEPINNNPFDTYSVNNYTWGVKLGIPLFLRKGRGDLRMTDLKIKQTELDLTSDRAGIEYKARASLNNWNLTADQIDLYTKTVRDYGLLLDGERRLFDIGESSLFMVNSREVGYINAQIKLIELLTKNRKAQLAAAHALGILNN